MPMEINKSILLKSLEQLDKQELIELLESAYDVMEMNTKIDVFGQYCKNEKTEKLSPENLLAQIEKFKEDSLNQVYYAPFNMNSKNFRYIPPETDEWFKKIGEYYDLTSELVMEHNYSMARKCFDILFFIMEKMEWGEEIVFAEEYEGWMILTKHDYMEPYIITLSNTASVQDYVQLIIPYIEDDSRHSSRQKIYKKVKRHSTEEQLEAIYGMMKKKSIAIN